MVDMTMTMKMMMTGLLPTKEKGELIFVNTAVRMSGDPCGDAAVAVADLL